MWTRLIFDIKDICDSTLSEKVCILESEITQPAVPTMPADIGISCSEYPKTMVEEEIIYVRREPHKM